MFTTVYTGTTRHGDSEMHMQAPLLTRVKSRGATRLL